MATTTGIQHLLTVPPRMAEAFESLTGHRPPDWFACSDPAGQPLGSGGGTAQLLASAWARTGSGRKFREWLRAPRKLLIHGGGQSRRLPAYAPAGKPLLPMPVFRWAYGQRLDQTLLDLQLPEYEKLLSHAPQEFSLMVASGDVLLRFGQPLPEFPAVDVLGLGMWVPAETAKDFGVFFVEPRNQRNLVFFLQKPSVGKIREFAEQYLCLVDTGMWLLSERAVEVLMRRCGWDRESEQFSSGQPGRYELYSQFGLALGSKPTAKDPEIAALSCAVVPLPQPEFYHFGTNRQMIESVAALHNLRFDGGRIGLSAARRHPQQVNVNSRLEAPLRREGDQAFWIENSVIPAGWQLSSNHVLTGIPENHWQLRLDPGICLDCVPVGEDAICVRSYGFYDLFSGKLADPSTLWFGLPVADWFFARGFQAGECGLDDELDIQHAPLFPVIERQKIDPTFVQWLVSTAPGPSEQFAALWRTLPRLSAAQLCEQVELRRLFEQRERLRELCVPAMMRNHRGSVFFRLDLESTAEAVARSKVALPELAFTPEDEALVPVHHQVFRSAILRHQRKPEWRQSESEAFRSLQKLLLNEAQLAPVQPRRNILEDQIIWARSPVRLDLGGGWTDTPPYCLEQGGAVTNVAVEINGQPPVQVFAKASPAAEIVLRSIDLGQEERVRTFDDLDKFGDPGSTFGLAKAALALAGFLPRFHPGPAPKSLKAQLEEFGGGIELSLLAAVPKGSGLGTSSILAVTLLAALNDLCALGWDEAALFARTLALEQMLTTGGGWQDQAGALFRGVKRIETEPGLTQVPNVHWLPEHLFGADYSNQSVLLYYTGLTRLAKNILADVVRGVFLNSPSRLRILGEIGANARFAADALQKCDYRMLATAVRNSWSLNQRLDPATNPPEVQQILGSISDYLDAAKLLGAGGGGYLLMFAKDASAGLEIKRVLAARPPNPRARFVNFGVSGKGLQVTRS